MSTETSLDFSKWNFPEDRIWIRISEWEMILKICTFVPLVIFGLYGNIILVHLIVVNRPLRTPTNMLIVNMAVADCLTLLISPSMFLINDFYQNYQLGAVGCKTQGFLEAAFLITAVLNLSAVSYDRLTAIVLSSGTRLTMRGVNVVIAMTWLGGFLLATPLAIYRSYKVRQWKNFRETYCKEDPDILPKYWYVLITVIVWLPLGVMLICYSTIFYKLDRYEKRVLNREHPLIVSYKKTVARTLFIVVIVFITLRLPFTVLVILREKFIETNNNNMVSESLRILWYISQYLMFLNAAINPLIYGFNNENFKRAYKQTSLFKCGTHERGKNCFKLIPTNNNSTNCILDGLRCIFSYLFCCICLRRNRNFDVADCQQMQRDVRRRSSRLCMGQRIITKETILCEYQSSDNIFNAENHENNVQINGECFI